MRFGADAFVNEVVWQRLSAHNDANRFGIVHDTIYLYSRSSSRTWTSPRAPLGDKYVEQFFDQLEPDTQRRYSRMDLLAKGLRKGESGRVWRGLDPASRGSHWKVGVGELDRLDAEGRIHWPKPGGMPRRKRYLDEAVIEGGLIQDLWNDVRPIHNQSVEVLDFPTQKPEALLDRIIRASSNPGDIVLDCFIGSGTTAAVAQKLGRRWIGADINKGAIQTTEKRLAAIMHGQIEAGGEQLTLEADAEAPLRPAQTSFTVRRVNDYDLQIQHNEALELAVEHLGVQRTRADTFFHGTLGKELVYIVPFDHPATVLDLEAVVRELEARPGDEHDVVVVGLGRELSTVAWLERHNRHAAVNRIRLIDLRTDEKHGRFFEHRPASAQVSFDRTDGRLQIRVDDVISPSILERLAGQEGILTARVQDWRSMVDSVAIDTAYDGEVFDVDLIDIPERRSDVVEGAYDLEAPEGDRPAAIRITDMLGEEILVVEARP